MNAVAIVNLIAGIAGFAAVLYLVVVAFRGDPERADEDAARRHFDEHGSWPDEAASR